MMRLVQMKPPELTERVIPVYKGMGGPRPGSVPISLAPRFIGQERTISGFALSTQSVVVLYLSPIERRVAQSELARCRAE
jgi:hypothetical protein